jgi:hypothetical protein
MNIAPRSLIPAIMLLSPSAIVFAQAPAGGRAPAPPRPILSVTSPDMARWRRGSDEECLSRRDKSPAFEFHWNLGVNPGTAPESLQTYAVIFHDV